VQAFLSCIIFSVSDYRFYHPVEIRYMDLGTRQHVNNARYLSYLEDARIAYRRCLDLPGDVGVILADTHITYHKPIFLEDQITVGVRVARIGNKSITYLHAIVDPSSQKIYATAEVVIVTYDYEQDAAVPVPEEWRRLIAEYEEL